MTISVKVPFARIRPKEDYFIKENMSKYPNWTQEEIDILVNFYEKSSEEELLNLLPSREFMGIRIKANRLGLHRMNYFTNDELDFIKNNSFLSNVEIGKILGRSPEVIGRKSIELGVSLKNEIWTKEDDLKLIENFPDGVEILFKKVFKNRSKSSIYHRIQQLGLQNKKNSYLNITNEEIIDAMKVVCEKIGRTPMSKELPAFNLPSATIIAKRFQSYGNFCKICCVDENRGYIKSCKLIDKRGDKCLSLSEKIISDFLFDNDVNYEKEIPYKQIIPSYSGKMRCDWLIDGKIVVEFFGMSRHKKYKERMNKKIFLCLDNNIKMIEIYETDLLNDKFKNKLTPFIK